MILTCPACGTQYGVKDGAIPPRGRQVRCASCKHSWHQDPAPANMGETESLAAAALIEPRSGPEAEERAYAEAALAVPAAEEPAAGDDVRAEDSLRTEEPAEAEEARLSIETPPGTGAVTEIDEEELANGGSYPQEDDFTPFGEQEFDEPKRRRPLLTLSIMALLIAALAAAFWFLAPPEWKARLGLVGASETPLQLMMTHSDRQTLASGNELLAVTGRVINPTDQSQPVPPIQAQLRSRSGQLVYSWTIAPPARTLPPGASATFNSAEVNVPAGGDELTISLGPKA